MSSRLAPPVPGLETGFNRNQKDAGTSEALRSIQNVELLEGILLESQEISSTTSRIPHNLGRDYRGFIPLTPIQGLPIHIDSSSTADKSKFIPLKLSDSSDITHIYGRATIDGSGVPTLVTSNGDSDGVKSITKSATGTYAIILGDVYFGAKTYDYFRFGEISIISNTADDIRGQVAVESVASDGLIKVFTLTGATKTDPASSSVLLFNFVVEKAVIAKSDLWVF